MSRDQLRTLLDAIPLNLPDHRRFVVAIAGPPAAGKSTLARDLVSAIGDHATAVGMDGFHFDDAILKARGHHDRKGAPHTFDADGYVRMVRTVRERPEQSVAVPVFDRSMELSRAAGAIVTPEHRIVVTEGNYLLLTEAPWSELADLFDLTVSLSPTMEVIESRIMNRWRKHGLANEVARSRFVTNDRPNAEYVLTNSRPAIITL